ncbi:hypothetical protein NM688_g2023 [Phlebia brevispora]|uniref:Uncharacterized protein n=1 Tax=Phlebia brevispora TaxID=194682 RepID=A0ACC1TA07_9APHY|nr:hypothetical protein NM688_g2023 [Phlebia brevispora]
MGASEGKTIGEVHIQGIPSDPPRRSQLHKGRRQKILAAHAEALASSSSAVHDLNWTWRSLTESSASRVPPVFTKDGYYFLTAAGPAVKIYSVASGQVVSTLSPTGTMSQPSQPTGYGDAISSMALNPHNSFQLFTGSLDGCIRLWDILDANLLQTIDISTPVMHLAVHEKFKNEVYVAVLKKANAVNTPGNRAPEDNAAVYRVSLIPTKATADSPVQKSSEQIRVGKTRAPLGLGFSPSGSWLVVIGGHKAYVAKTTDLKGGFTKFVSPEKLTCLAFHPSEEYFATGDTKGVVRLWYCLNDSIPSGLTGTEKRAPTTTLHWHAHAVSALAFTSNGAYLLSGGEEAVLIIWQLHTGKKEFVPRVGSPITTITVSKSAEEQYLLGLADASFVSVRSGTLRISKVIARVKLDSATAYDRTHVTSAPLAVHSLSSSLILPSSHPSTLQTYSPVTSKLISELEISPSNRVSRREDNPLEPCRVEQASVSEGGEWMATVDGREGSGGFGAEIYLKIWNWDRKASSWTLNTRVDRPHGLKSITSISFRPRGKDDGAESLVTTGEDGTIKVWGTRSSSKGEVFWVARSTTRFRSEVPTHASWSLDGSLLTVSLGPYAVLYDPSTMLVIKNLTCPECPLVLSTHFVGQGGRYLAFRGYRDLVLWDLITESVRWRYHSTSSLQRVFPHPRDGTFVVFESHTQTRTTVTKFNVESVTPISTRFLPFYLLNVALCPSRWMLAKDPSSFTFVGITGSWTVVLLGDQIHLAEDDTAGPRSLAGIEQTTKRTLFQDLFGKVALSDAPKPLPTSFPSNSSSWKGKEVEKVFETPAYLLPPLGSLFDPLIDEFLTLRTTDESATAEDDSVSEDEDAEMAEEGSQTQIIIGNRLERIVDAKEMVAMIELFQHHAIHSPAPNSMSPPLRERT